MSVKPDEINDNEIRIISSYKKRNPNMEYPKVKRRRPKWRLWALIILGILILAGVVVLLISRMTDAEDENENIVEVTEPPVTKIKPPLTIEEKPADIKGFTVALDTIINKNGLLILSPVNARPRLVVGTESLNDSTIILATQAADVRGDNGQIAGTFVLDGELISKGEAKAGYCSIINGDLSIGIADATPMLEQALTEGGYFFRQYPLVVGGQIVENKPKGNAIRKALAEIGGQICVVMSKERLTFHDFSQLLIDADVRNAIYLVGGTSYGFYVNKQGDKIPTGNVPMKDVENASYIIWE